MAQTVEHYIDTCGTALFAFLFQEALHVHLELLAIAASRDVLNFKAPEELVFRQDSFG